MCTAKIIVSAVTSLLCNEPKVKKTLHNNNDDDDDDYDNNNNNIYVNRLCNFGRQICY